ncbi:flagellar hook-associated protein 2 [Oikeobacillus pervagus]|uniref:Flagellar hook-associated protein 2 n=1 Tax=Oikeobacillus pervagus TaxID=1325931 RepID=A0AAJ1T166_9BACI|nr:flagellar filament capping protein FliD [Oikeobacillus pervagus]MDQ0214912.1 flagellar hook-associated protein 2 [Oikeobacillus pervagus]
MRIGGLASGMDIDQLVKDLMKAERMPLDKLKQKKQILEWQRDDYRSINSLLLDFRSQLTQMKLTTNYRVRTTSSTNESYVTATATSAAGQSSYSISQVSQLATAETKRNGGSIIANDKEFDATKGLYKQKDSFTYQGVSGMWKDGFVQSKQKNTTSATKKMDLGLQNIKADSIGDWTVTVNGVGYKVVSEFSNSEGSNLKEVMIDSTTGELTFNHELAKDSIVRVGYISETKTETLTLSKDTNEWKLSYRNVADVTLKLKNGENISDLTVSNGEISKDGKKLGTLDPDGKITFTDEGKSILLPDGSKETVSLEITYKSDDAKYTTMSMETHTSKGERYESFLIDGRDSMNTIVNKVNSSSLGVTMFYDDVTSQMTMTRNETGDFNKKGDEILLNLADDSNSFLRDVLRFSEASVTQVAKDAKFTINGLETNRHSNTFEMNGVTFTLKQTFDSITDTTISPVSISIHNDSEKVFENIKEFVKNYNEIIDKIQKKTSEERYRSYKPLTDEQREQLSDKQQEQWEEKAKSGLLRRDPILGSILTQMRMDFSQPVLNDRASLFNQLAKIGITTTSNYLEGGKLEINEAKLKKAIEEDPQAIENFFRGDGATNSQKGVIHRLYDTVSKTMDQLNEKAGKSFSVNHQFAIGRELNNVGDRIESFEDRLKYVEDRYWKQFNAMEKAIQRSNQQMMYLMQQFGGGM